MIETIFELGPSTLVKVKTIQVDSDPDEQEFDYKQAASNLINSLNGEYCILFMEELQKQCERILFKYEEDIKRIDELYKKL